MREIAVNTNRAFELSLEAEQNVSTQFFECFTFSFELGHVHLRIQDDQALHSIINEFKD